MQPLLLAAIINFARTHLRKQIIIVASGLQLFEADSNSDSKTRECWRMLAVSVLPESAQLWVIPDVGE
jgi:hypothetical protein